jgi:hypothetical protein
MAIHLGPERIGGLTGRRRLLPPAMLARPTARRHKGAADGRVDVPSADWAVQSSDVYLCRFALLS